MSVRFLGSEQAVQCNRLLRRDKGLRPWLNLR
jgi:hypothetical protein